MWAMQVHKHHRLFVSLLGSKDMKAGQCSLGIRTWSKCCLIVEQKKRFSWGSSYTLTCNFAKFNGNGKNNVALSIINPSHHNSAAP